MPSFVSLENIRESSSVFPILCFGQARAQLGPVNYFGLEKRIRAHCSGPKLTVGRTIFELRLAL